MEIPSPIRLPHKQLAPPATEGGSPILSSIPQDRQLESDLLETSLDELSDNWTRRGPCRVTDIDKVAAKQGTPAPEPQTKTDMADKPETGEQVEDTGSLMVEMLASLSLWLQEHYAESDRRFCVQGKDLTLEEVFGVDGLLVAFLAVATARIKATRAFDIHMYCVSSSAALGEILPRLKGDPEQIESLRLLRDTIVEIVGEIQVEQVNGQQRYSVDDIYQKYYDMAQNAEIEFQNEDVPLETASQQAKRLFEQKSYDEAVALLYKVAKVRESVLGVGNLSTLECQHRIAACLLEQGNAAEARRMLESNIRTLKQVHGESHVETLRTCDRLASVYRQLGETMRAMDTLNQALGKAMSTLGAQHELTLQLTRSVQELQSSLMTPDSQEPTVEVCNADQFQARRQNESEKDNDKKLASLTGLTQPKRLPFISLQVFPEIERIGQEQPNFAEVTELVLNTLHSQALTGRPAQLPPMLLSGPPGVGKTRYIKRIAAALGVPFADIQLAGVPDAFRISGLSRYWGTAGEGVIANVFATKDVANPVFLLDEIDKTKNDRHGDPLSVILLLLEKETSRCFKDSFVDVPLDVSHASFIATANDISDLPDPLLSRFHHIEIRPLDEVGRRTMIATTYRELLVEEGLTAFMNAQIPDATLDMLVSCELPGGRELKREILLAMQRACREFSIGQKASAILLVPKHLKLPETRVKRPIGFAPG